MQKEIDWFFEKSKVICDQHGYELKYNILTMEAVIDLVVAS